MSWEVKRLGDVVTVKKRINSGSALPYVGMEHISSGTGEFLGELNPVAVKSSTFFFEPGQLLYGRLRPYLNKVLLPEFKGHCSTEVFPIQPSPAIDKKFLFYWFTSDLTVSRIDATCTGARMPRADVHEVLDFEIPVPPLPEQQRIVGKLDAAFAALTEAQAHVERNRANARELFESYLNGVFEGKDWPMRKLKDVSLEFGRGKSKHRPRNDKRLYGGKYPFVQTGDVRNSEHFITEYTQTYNEFGLSQSKLWPKGTLCITIAANIAETAILGFDGCFPDSVVGMVADPKQCDIHYVEYLLQSFKSILQAQGKGSAQDNLNLATFEAQAFPFPSLQEQKKIAAALDELTDRTRQLETTYQQKLTELAGLKKAVLGAAFRGEL